MTGGWAVAGADIIAPARVMWDMRRANNKDKITPSQKTEIAMTIGRPVQYPSIRIGWKKDNAGIPDAKIKSHISNTSKTENP
jgi:hypothetical protein